eukprot:NODE_301_length_10368_cov_0.471614.p1 type:complete len:881 gc:universal NODE_301_length_10368_cov_0.471614:8688-6046(-)
MSFISTRNREEMENLLVQIQQPLTPLPAVEHVYKIKNEKMLGKCFAYYLKKQDILKVENFKEDFIKFCIDKKYSRALTILAKHGYCNEQVEKYVTSINGKYKMKIIGYMLAMRPNQGYLDFMMENLSKPWKYTCAKVLAIYFQRSQVNLSEIQALMRDYRYTQGILLLLSEFVKLRVQAIPNDILYEYLHLDKRVGTASVGQGIRDYTCFVFWRKLRENQMEETKYLALHLIASCCFDPAHHVRRASSAVFMELVGRHKIEFGLLLLPHLDFFTIGNSLRAYDIGVRISTLSSFHAKGLLFYLLNLICNTIDTELLEKRCHAVSEIIKFSRDLSGSTPFRLRPNNSNPLNEFTDSVDLSMESISVLIGVLFKGHFFQVQSASYLVRAVFSDSVVPKSLSNSLSVGNLADDIEVSKRVFVSQQILPQLQNPRSLNLTKLFELSYNSYLELIKLVKKTDLDFPLKIKCTCVLAHALLSFNPSLNDLKTNLLCIMFNKVPSNVFSIYDDQSYAYSHETKNVCISALSKLNCFSLICENLHKTNMDVHILISIDYFELVINELDLKGIQSLIEVCEAKYNSITFGIGQIRSKILNLYQSPAIQVIPNYTILMLTKIHDALIDYTNEKKGDTGSFVRFTACTMLSKMDLYNLNAEELLLLKNCTSHVLFASFSNIDKLRHEAQRALNYLSQYEILGLNNFIKSIYKVSWVSGVIIALSSHNKQRIDKILAQIKAFSYEERSEFVLVFTNFKRKECKLNQIFCAGCLLIESNLCEDFILIDYLLNLFNRLIRHKNVKIQTEAILSVSKLIFIEDLPKFILSMIDLLTSIPRLRLLTIEQLYNIYSVVPEHFGAETEVLLTQPDWASLPEKECRELQSKLKFSVKFH